MTRHAESLALNAYYKALEFIELFEGDGLKSQWQLRERGFLPLPVARAFYSRERNHQPSASLDPMNADVLSKIRRIE